MILDVARHKFYEGVATLFVVATIVAVRVALLPAIAVDTIAEGGAPLVAPLARFESAHPILTAILAALFCVQSALRLARATVRYNIYGTSSMAAISLIALLFAALAITSPCLSTMLVALLVAEGIGRLFYCLGPNTRLHYLFTSMLSLGATPLVDSSMLAVVILALVLMLTMRSNPREMIVTIVGITLPVLTYNYIIWCSGGSFSASFLDIWHDMLTPSAFSIDAYLTIPRLAILAVVLFVVLCSVLLYRSERLTLTRTARNIWAVMQAAMLILTPVFILLPSSSPASFITVAMIASTMMPLFFLKMNNAISITAYLVIIALALWAL